MYGDIDGVDGYTAIDLEGAISNDMDDLGYQILDGLSILEKKYGIDSESHKNITRIIGYASSDLVYEIEKERDYWDPTDTQGGLFSYDWDYKYDDKFDITDLAKTLAVEDSAKLDGVLNWYTRVWDKLDVHGDDAVDLFLTTFKKNKGDIDEEGMDEEEFRRAVNAYDSKKRESDPKAPQQTLDLSHFIYLANRYI